MIILYSTKFSLWGDTIVGFREDFRGNRVQEAPFALSPYSGTGYCVGYRIWCVFVISILCFRALGGAKETRHLRLQNTKLK